MTCFAFDVCQKQSKSFFFFFWGLLEYNVVQSLPKHVSFNFKANI